LFRDEETSLHHENSLLRLIATLLRGKATFLSDEEALLRRRTTYKHQHEKNKGYDDKQHKRVSV